MGDNNYSLFLVGWTIFLVNSVYVNGIRVLLAKIEPLLKDSNGNLISTITPLWFSNVRKVLIHDPVKRSKDTPLHKLLSVTIAFYLILIYSCTIIKCFHELIDLGRLWLWIGIIYIVVCTLILVFIYVKGYQLYRVYGSYEPDTVSENWKAQFGNCFL